MRIRCLVLLDPSCHACHFLLGSLLCNCAIPVGVRTRFFTALKFFQLFSSHRHIATPALHCTPHGTPAQKQQRPKGTENRLDPHEFFYRHDLWHIERKIS